MEAIPSRGSLAEGFRSLSRWRLILLLAGTTVALALFAGFALRPALSASFQDTLAGDHVLSNHPTDAPTDVLEFFHDRRDALAGTARVALYAGFLGLVLQIFFAGGFVSALGMDGPLRLADFFAAARRHFWHNVKCFAIFLVATGLTIGAWLAITLALSRRLFQDVPPGALSTFLFRLSILLGSLLFYAIFSLLHDFARAARRYADVGAWRAYAFARRALARSKARALGLFFFWLLAGGTVCLLLATFEWGTAAVSIAAILLHTLLQLAVITARSAVRVAAWGSYVALLDGSVSARTDSILIESGQASGSRPGLSPIQA